MLPQRQTFQLITNYLQSSTTLTTMSALLSQHPAAHLDHKIDLSSLGITIIDILETFPV